MRITVTVDDDVYKDALKSRPNAALKELLDEALSTFIKVEAGKRLANMGGTLPDLIIAPRKRIDW